MITHSLTHSLTLRLAAVAIFGLQGLVSQSLQSSTYDWPNGVSLCSNDRWMDVKAPGDGRTYCIGTTIVPDTTPSSAPHFSNAPVDGPTMVAPVTSSRQVAILQVSDANGIIWQKYFYGATTGQTGGGLSTFGRAVAVFPGATPSETRIAICGETFDEYLPNSVTLPNTHFGNLFATGYVAVYDGVGNLKWARQFYGQDVSGDTVITDVSIHVSNGDDVVTYCGASTNGALVNSGITLQSTMAPTNCSFLGNVPPACNDVPAPHDIHNAAQGVPTAQWDGIVGRVQKPHNFSQTTLATSNAPLTFHGIVGGVHQEGLFGISEQSPTEFVVVGSTQKTNSSSNSVFVPLTNPSTFNSAQGTFCFSANAASWQSFGTVFRFTVNSGTHLCNLVSSTLIGSNGTNTVARDVVWHNGLMWIVGSTDDPNFTSLDPSPFLSHTNNGIAEGFVVTCTDPGLGFLNSTLVDSHVAELTGIAAWNEFPDHVAVIGKRTLTTTNVASLYVASLFRDTSLITPAIRVVRSTELGGSMDTKPAFSAGLAVGIGSTAAQSWISPVGTPEGGGVAVDPRGRVTAVGSAEGDDYPLEPQPPSGPTRAPQSNQVPRQAHSTDGVRSELDMLPAGLASVGACRTDGTGTCPSPGWAASPNYTGTGGTTPTCGIGLPAIRRMLIDFEGILAAGSTNATILVDRPAIGSSLQASVMWIGFPSTTPVVTVEGIESWVNQTAVSQILGNLATTNRSLVVPLGVLPAGGNTFSIQFVSLLAGPVCSGNPNSTLGASPALIFGY